VILNGGHPVEFGDRIEDMEKMFSIQAVDNPSPVARHPRDKIIQVKNVSLEFDSGRLHTVLFKNEYAFGHDLNPYLEAWKNFPEIGSKRVFHRMCRDEFVAYVDEWEARAISLGAERVDRGDMSPSQFHISSEVDRSLNMIHISMGPTRRAGGGGIWCDGWTALFAHKREEKLLPHSECVLEELAAFRDEFNTVARRATT
jgi:hypothetical protein